jgi:hypothetical protein
VSGLCRLSGCVRLCPTVSRLQRPVTGNDTVADVAPPSIQADLDTPAPPRASC